MAEQNHEILRVEHLKKFFPVPNGMLHAVDDISLPLMPEKHWALLVSLAVESQQWDVPYCVSTSRRMAKYILTRRIFGL